MRNTPIKVPCYQLGEEFNRLENSLFLSQKYNKNKILNRLIILSENIIVKGGGVINEA